MVYLPRAQPQPAPRHQPEAAPDTKAVRRSVETLQAVARCAVLPLIELSLVVAEWAAPYAAVERPQDTVALVRAAPKKILQSDEAHRHVKNLGHGDFRVRERAFAALKKSSLDRPGFIRLAGARFADDAESHNRARQLFQDHFPEHTADIAWRYADIMPADYPVLPEIRRLSLLAGKTDIPGFGEIMAKNYLTLRHLARQASDGRHGAEERFMTHFFIYFLMEDAVRRFVGREDFEDHMTAMQEAVQRVLNSAVDEEDAYRRGQGMRSLRLSKKRR